MKIKWNLRLITIVPIILLLLISLYYLFNSYSNYMQVNSVSKEIYNTKTLKTLAINLSRERGLSILYMKNNNQKIKELLIEQRVATDTAINSILNFSSNPKSDINGYKIIDNIKKIHKKREEIDNHRTNFDTIFTYYDGISSDILQKVRSYLSNPINTKTDNLSQNFIKASTLMRSIANERDVVINLINSGNSLNKTYLLSLFKNNRVAANFETLLPIYKDRLKEVINDKEFVNSIRNSDKVKRDLLESNDFSNSINPIEWFSYETDKLIFVNKISNILYDNILNELNKQKQQLIYKMAFLAFLLLLSLYMLYIYNRLHHFLYDTDGLEKLLNKIVKYGLIEDTIDLRTTTGIDQTYSVIEQSVEKISIEKKKAERANAAKSIFLANMSHEIRTPINGIIGFTDLLKNSKLKDQEKEYVNIIQKSTDNLLEIINNILDLSKVESKKIEIDDILFSPIEEFENAVDVYMAKAESKNINLSLFMDPDFDHYLLGDPTKIKEVLLNLISNAIKFTPENGQVSVKIIKQQTTNNNIEKIYFEVSDTGIGIDKKDIHDIFDAFSQADSTITRKFGGTGLGLTISSNYISLMGGKLELQSNINEGSNFYFTLELKKEKPLKTIYKKYFSHFNPLIITTSKENSELDKHLIQHMSYLCDGEKNGTIDKLSDPEALTDVNLIVTQADTLKDEDLTLLKGLNIPILDTTKTYNRSDIKDESDNGVFKTYEPINTTKIIKTLKIIEEKTNFVPTELDKRILDNNKKYRVLVAEDNEINQKLITTILNNLNFDVTTVENGKEALEIRKKEVFDIIFMDIAMPIMDGVSATKEILEYERAEKLDHIPIIALTANALKGDREKFLNDGLDDYLPKPTKEAQIKEIAIKYNVYNEMAHKKENKNIEIKDTIIDDQSILIQEDSIKKEASESEANLSAEFERENILIYKKSTVESKIFEKVLSQLYKKVDIANDSSDFISKIKKGNHKVIMVDKEIMDLNLQDLFDNVKDRDNTTLLLFRGFDSIIDDQTRRDFDEVLINSADKVYLKLILDNYLKATDKI